MQSPQKGSERADDLLHAEAAVGLRSSAKEGVDLIQVEPAKGRRPLVDFQKPKEGADPTAVSQDSPGRQAAYLTQIGAEELYLTLYA